MNTKALKTKKNIFETFALNVAKTAGSTVAFISALTLVIAWLFLGPVFHYSETWQLIINTTTTIITFLMVFLIQKAQNKDSLAIQLKINELVASHQFASNRLIDVENMTEDELRVIKKYYSKLSVLVKTEQSLLETHSIDEAELRHRLKHEKAGKDQHLKEKALNNQNI